MQRVHIYIDTDSTVLRSTPKQYGYVLELEGNPNTCEGFGELEGSYHKATLVAIAAALDRMRKPCEIQLHVPDALVANMLPEIDRRASEGFVDTIGNPIANREEWKKVREQIWKFEESHIITPITGTHPYSEWIKREMECRKTRENTDQT